jgi:hypothetical protein
MAKTFDTRNLSLAITRMGKQTESNFREVLKANKAINDKLAAVDKRIDEICTNGEARFAALEARAFNNPMMEVGAVPQADPLPRFYIEEYRSFGQTNFYIRDRVRKAKVTSLLGGDDAILTGIFSDDTSVGAAKAAAKEYCAWLNDMETKKQGPVKTVWRNVWPEGDGVKQINREYCDRVSRSLRQRIRVERVDTYADGTETVTVCS